MTKKQKKVLYKIIVSAVLLIGAFFLENWFWVQLGVFS